MRRSIIAHDAAVVVAEGRAADLARQYVSVIATDLARTAAAALLGELVDGAVEAHDAVPLVAAVREEALARLIGTPQPIRRTPVLTLVPRKPTPPTP